MVVKNLEFFDKNGYNLNLNWNEQKQIWEGNIFFPRVSVGLYENTTIYVAEFGGYDSDYTDDVFTYPTGEGNIVFQWDLANTFVDEFFMFNFDENYELKDTSSLIYTPYDGPLGETLIINRFDKYIVPLLGSSQNIGIEKTDLMEIHVAFIADENSAETTYKRTLVMSYEEGYTKYTIARITFFAETIEEDERLKIWNENLGYNLKPEDTIIFKQSDMHECMPDYEMLNEKRKELMLEGHNIYPYIGGYKAILNAIKFFGYDNLNIIEYWRNINEYDSEYGKICRNYVYSLKDRKILSTKRKTISLDTKNYRKLNNISLVYNINHTEEVDSKKYDEYGLPNVIEDFDKDKRDDFRLTIEEALVKLFALKKKLNDEFMPGSTKIIDIVGEGNYFGINLIGNNPQISTVNYIDSKGYIDFSVFPDKYCYITENEDFARFIAEKKDANIEIVDPTIGNVVDKTIAELSVLYDGSDSDSDVSINEIDTGLLDHIIDDLMKKDNDYVCECYEEYYNITYDNKFGDAKKFGLRELPDGKNVYEDTIDSDSYSDDNGYVPNMNISAKVILKGCFSEDIDGSSIVEWKITHQESEWTETYMGGIKTYGNMFVQLPYLGKYDVEMTVWDVYNHCSKKNVKDAIIVEPYNIDIRGFYYDARPLPDGLKYDLFIPKEYRDDIEKEYQYYLWTKTDGNKHKAIVTYKRNSLDENNEVSMTISDIFGETDILTENPKSYMLYCLGTKDRPFGGIPGNNIHTSINEILTQTHLMRNFPLWLFADEIPNSSNYIITMEDGKSIYDYLNSDYLGSIIYHEQRNRSTYICRYYNDFNLTDIKYNHTSYNINIDEICMWQMNATEVFDNEGNVTLNFSSPIRISAPYGEFGKDGDDIDFAYCLSNVNTTPLRTPATDSIYYDSNGHYISGSSFVIENTTYTWTGEPKGVTKTHQYEFMSMRTKASNGRWSEWSIPILWSKYGHDVKISNGVYGYIDLENVTDINRENWISIVNTEDDGNDVLKISYSYNDENDITIFDVDTFNFVEELTEVPFDENDSYVPEWNTDALYHVIKNNVDKMYFWALQEHVGAEDVNASMGNYRPDGSVSQEGPYYKFDVDTILYRVGLGYKEYDHLNEDIINLKPGKHYEYVRYINGVVDIKPLTWILLGFDYTRITGRIVDSEYPKWTLTLIGNELDIDEDMREDKVINIHNGLYFTYLFETEGSYKIKLEMKDINGNEYELERFIVIVDRDANYEMYHTLNDEYNKYLEAKNERNLIYLN